MNAFLSGWLRLGAVLALVLLPSLQSTPVRADDDDDCEVADGGERTYEDEFCEGQAIVRLKPGVDVEEFNPDYDTRTIDSIASQNTHLLLLPASAVGNEPQFAAELGQDQRVDWAEVNYTDQAPEGRPRYFFLSGDAPGGLGRSYAPDLLRVESAHACATGAGVTVAVIDTGIDDRHRAFDRRLAGVWNAFTGTIRGTADVGNGNDDDGDGRIDEMVGHGTHVAGIVVQAAPQAKILAIKALNDDGFGQAFYLARAIYHAVERDAEVVNLSLSSTADTRIVAEAVAEAVGAGVFVAAAAGNAGHAQPEYPAAGTAAFGVAATNRSNRAATFTNRHPNLDIAAPGVKIVSAFPGGKYKTWDGTSMATPWVSGAAALLMDRNDGWSPQQVAQRLQVTAATIDGPSDGMGAGRLAIGAALACRR